MLRAGRTYEEVYGSFRWEIPARYNIAADACDRHAEATPDAVALIYETEAGEVRRTSFRELRRLADRCANMLAAHGLKRGDRLGILLGQTPETAVAHLACWKLGVISIPMFTLFGEEALAWRFGNSGAVAVVTDRENWPKVAAIREQAPALKLAFLIDGEEEETLPFWRELEKARDRFETLATGPDDPAFISYTSGTTGPPKGALHAHRTLLGHMTGFDVLHDFFGQPGDLSWSPADWAWIAGLMDVLFPTLRHGKPVLAFRTKGRFDPERAYHMMAKHRVRNGLFVPTMLKAMRQAKKPAGVALRSCFTGGESVGPEILEWGRAEFGITLNEGFGQTECNIVLAHTPLLMEARFGSLGKPAPGHVGAIVDDEGRELPAGEEGHIAFRRPDPVMMLEYWANPDATRAKYAGDWLLTGDLGRRDEDGYFWYVGRADDVITSAGYRIGPGEIEDCLLKHPAVAVAAAIGVPDPARTEIIKAFIVPAPGHAPSPALEEDIREFVRRRLAQHEYPRLIEFVDELPTTATGKVMRRVLREREKEKRGRAEA